MPKGKRRIRPYEQLAGVGKKKTPSKLYPEQTWTYECLGCGNEVRWSVKECPNCSKVFDWSKSVLVDAKDYDTELQRKLREAIDKRSRRGRRA